MKTVLEINNLNYTYHTPEGETPALKNISFSVKSGEFLSIVRLLPAAGNLHFFLSYPDFSLLKQERYNLWGGH